MKTATETITTTKWIADPTHSEVTFKVRHLMISNVKGEFTKFQVEVETESDDFSASEVQATIDASSVSTNDANRDTHLKSADFFDAEKFPTLTFKGISFTKKGNDYQLSGVLTIKGVSKTATFAVEFGGVRVDPYGNEKAGFSIEGTINRKDFGLNWNAALETGGVLVSDDVKISADVQLVKQK